MPRKGEKNCGRVMLKTDYLDTNIKQKKGAEFYTNNTLDSAHYLN
jgi:hypothetical protein